MDLYDLKKIISFALEPESESDFEDWMSQKEVVDYLENEAKDDYIIICAFLPHTFIHSVFIPNIEINKDTIEDLKKWDGHQYLFNGLGYSPYIEDFLSGSKSKILNTGEQIVFRRSFEAINDNKNYYELNQKLVHALDIHYFEERKSWRKLDGHGDIVEVFKVLEVNTHLTRNDTGIIICAKKKELSEYMSTENLVLIRMLDLVRHKHDFKHNFSLYDLAMRSCFHNHENEEFRNSASVYISSSITPSISYSRGFQFIDLSVPQEQMAKRFGGIFNGEKHKEYCFYMAYDWKNKSIGEISCNPTCLFNYFTKSKFPLGSNVAFFKPEVLLKYKNDREKYTLGHYSVDCRSTWHLGTFGVNDAGQIHTDLASLSDLPYTEQCYWKQYNEESKAPKTDFSSQKICDTLLSLKLKLYNLCEESVPWWTLRDEGALGKVHYPYTESTEEWTKEIANLDQLLIEGLEEKWLRRKAKELGCNPDARLRSLKLLEAILAALGFEEEHAREIMTPLYVVHKLRSIEAHTSGAGAEMERKKALEEHGSFKKHFEKICGDCDESVKIITDAIKK